MKNYFVILLAKVNSSFNGANLSEKYEDYKEMSQILEGSAKKHLKNLDEIKYITGEFDSTVDLFKHCYLETYNLLHSEPCNVLSSMADQLFIKKSDIFNEYNYFSLFGPNAGPNCCPSCGPISLDGMRFFHHSCVDEIIEVNDKQIKMLDYGKDLWTNPQKYDIDLDCWGQEMVIHNKMFYKQKNSLFKREDKLIEHLEKSKKYHHITPDGWQSQLNGAFKTGVGLGRSLPYIQRADTYGWIPYEMDKCNIVIFGATRGQTEILNYMKHLNEKYN